MIIDAILLVFQSFLEVLLAPLTVLNIVIDIVSSIPVVSSFINVVMYILPWSNIAPVVVFIIAMFAFRGVLALIRLIKSFIPTMGYWFRKGDFIMLKTLFYIFYYICIIYFLVYEFSYIYLKFIKKDIRLKDIHLFNYLMNTNKILKGDK